MDIRPYQNVQSTTDCRLTSALLSPNALLAHAAVLSIPGYMYPVAN